MNLEKTDRPFIEKPLGIKSYGNIGHLPGSRVGCGDHHICEGQAKIALTKARDKHDIIIVQEKLDGSNVGVANIKGEIVPLIRAGYRAIEVFHLQHKYFHNWVFNNLSKFKFLPERWRICGEWLAQVHSTRYDLFHEPFVAFDILNEKNERITYLKFEELCNNNDIVIPFNIEIGPPCSIEKALKRLGEFGHHGAKDPVEGAVWRVERKGKVDFMGKYVRPEKKDGEYFDNIQWNWQEKNNEVKLCN